VAFRGPDVDGVEPHVPGQREHDLLGLRVVSGDQDRGGDPVHLRGQKVACVDVVPAFAHPGARQPLLDLLGGRAARKRLPLMHPGGIGDVDDHRPVQLPDWLSVSSIASQGTVRITTSASAAAPA